MCHAPPDRPRLTWTSAAIHSQVLADAALTQLPAVSDTTRPGKPSPVPR